MYIYLTCYFCTGATGMMGGDQMSQLMGQMMQAMSQVREGKSTID